MYYLLYILVTILWLVFFGRPIIKKGKKLKRTPVYKLMPPFFSGMLAGPIAGFVSKVMENLFGKQDALSDFTRHFLLVGPIEEFIKVGAFLLACLRRNDFTSIGNGVRLAITVALGFAGGENILYMHIYGVEKTLPRLFLAHAGHAGYAIFWGYALSAILIENASFSLFPALLLLAAALHGAYNYFLGFSIPGLVFSVSLTILLFILTKKLIDTEEKRNVNL